MTQDEYQSAMLAISSANLTANARNLELSERRDNDTAQILALLTDILKEVKAK